MFDTSCLFDLVGAPRFAVPFLISVLLGAGVYYWTGQEPSSAAIAFLMGLIGFCFGVVLHIAGGKSNKT